MSEMKAFKELAAKSTQRPYYVGPDYAGECPPHNNSGLALIETGRAEDWPCARLCEWPTAAFLTLAANYVERLVEQVRDDGPAYHAAWCGPNPFDSCALPECVQRRILLAEIEEAAKGDEMNRQEQEARSTVALDSDTRRACNNRACLEDFGHVETCSDGTYEGQEMLIAQVLKLERKANYVERLVQELETMTAAYRSTHVYESPKVTHAHALLAEIEEAAKGER